ncbi:MAG: hypothetical protein HS117_16510 [Verrucomicrobiaceae bacterium]|jgi:hypothetical protein|nr:hypothetical protein [Verrucomicrobiaceae bacterium]
MKAIVTASTLAAALVILPSCYGPGGPPPPGGRAGPRGYTLDKPPGRYGAPEQPAPPEGTRYLSPELPPGADPNAAATVQPPAPGAVPPPAAGPDAATAPGSGPAAPIVVTPPGSTPPPSTANTTTPPASTTPPATTSYPKATRTKPGFVKSPFDPLGREIDVRDMRSGQKARCPYTQKVFLVP